MQVEVWPIGRPKPYAHNPRKISEDAIEHVARSLEQFGWRQPVVVDDDGVIIVGHTRWQAALKLGMTEVPVQVASDLTPDQVRAYRIADNRVGEFTEWDQELLGSEISLLLAENYNTDVLAFDDAYLEKLFGGLEEPGAGGDLERGANGALQDRFGVPPFSTLDARQGYWQDRKRAWIAKGIASAEGRDDDLVFATTDKYMQDAIKACGGGTSIFDPVLCELAYKWYCPDGGRVIDPFAGGSVRGAVAAILGLDYCGVDLRPEQVEANASQMEVIGDVPGRAAWVVGDSSDGSLMSTLGAAQFMLTCPPYGDLETYSDDPADLSNMPLEQFNETYAACLANAVARLEDNSFAVIVVGDYRDKKGSLVDFVSTTIAAMRGAGCDLYNEGILITPVGTLALRVGRQFEIARKLGKSHQNVLVFVKGDWREAVAKLSPPEFAVPDEEAA